MEKTVLDALRGVLDPEFGISVVDLGLIYGVEVQPDGVHVRMTLTTPSCPLHDTILEDVERTAAAASGTRAIVELVWEPAWVPERISPEALAQLQA
ncbi:MAG: metal-sulfur cluster assembly factor [Candidatus Sericytochromatia bacterium]